MGNKELSLEAATARALLQMEGAVKTEGLQTARARKETALEGTKLGNIEVTEVAMFLLWELVRVPALSYADNVEIGWRLGQSASNALGIILVQRGGNA
jgi:hypothetical protein